MATVVITFFLFARFYVCKMDADCIERQRDQIISRREKRWSMNSQRLEEIVAELMKPISDVRRSFDTDLSALLEEYLTEAGLHALDAGEDSSPADAVAPNFAELALLLQQSASIYGRKVDFLYQHVLDVSDSLNISTQEMGNSTSEESQTPTTSRRRRKASWVCGEFAHIELQASAAARREPGAARPPPTLARRYAELEPRALTAADAPLRDYAGEPIGLLQDFQVAWRLHEGMLVDELESTTRSGESALRPISLVELQAAIEAAAPPLPPPLEETVPREDSLSPCPLRTSTPLPEWPEPPVPPLPDQSKLPMPSPPPMARKARKRRSDVKIDDIIDGGIKIVIGPELKQKLGKEKEFIIASRLISRIVTQRMSHILNERWRLRDLEPDPPPAFAGWSSAEAAAATAAASGWGASGASAELESDDDGFFELSSVASDKSRADERDAAAWQARVLQRADSERARGADVRALAARVLGALPPRQPCAFADVLRRAAADDADVSRLLLATLFLANAGNVEVLAGPAGGCAGPAGGLAAPGSFALRLLSPDQRLYCAAAAAELLR